VFMDYQDFGAAQRIVAELVNCMNILPERLTNPRPFAAIMGNLTDFLMHIYHHTLGGKCLACDLDFVEVRDGKIAGLIELKKVGRTMSPTQVLVTGTLSKLLKIPVYLLNTNRDFTTFTVSLPKGKDELVLNRRELYEFMQEFEIPDAGSVPLRF